MLSHKCRCAKWAVEYAKRTEKVLCAVYSRKLGCEVFGAASSEDYADTFPNAEALVRKAASDYFLVRKREP